MAPLVTVLLFGVTSFFMVLQSVEPTILDALRRTPDAFADHEYWRAITPLLVHAGGWPQYVTNAVLLLAFGALLERSVGGAITLVIYVVSGIVAQFLGFAWRPHGAGASVGVASLIGASVVLRTWQLGRRVRVVVALVLAAVVAVSVVVRDIHGAPLVVGAVSAVFYMKRSPRSADSDAAVGQTA